MSGTLYNTGDSYYLYSKRVLLNDLFEANGRLITDFFTVDGITYAPTIVGDLQTVLEVKEDFVQNYDVETRKMFPSLGNEEMIPRKITESITIIPLDKLPDIFLDEIKKSKVEIRNSIIIKDENELWKFEGNTYSYRIHDNSFYLTSANIIKFSDDEYWIKVNPGDQVINTHTDNRGYPASCGTDNKNKDVIMIVKWTPVEKPPIGKIRDLSKGE